MMMLPDGGIEMFYGRIQQRRRKSIHENDLKIGINYKI
jgi:hypothetical protein